MRKRRGQKEEWRPVPEHSDYEVSNFGRVRSYKDRHAFGRRRLEEPVILSQQISEKGYKFVRLKRNNGTMHKAYINKLVGLVYILNPDNKPEVNHKDGNKANNHVSNLEWATHAENMEHAKRTGLWIPERNIAIALESWRRKIYCYELDEIFDSVDSAAKYIGVDKSAVTMACRRNTFFVKGQHVCYEEDINYLRRNIDKIKEREGGRKRVKAINVDTGEERIYLSRREASKDLDITESYISNIIAGRSYQTRGWAFEDLPIEMEERLEREQTY